MCLGIPYKVVKVLDEESCLVQVGSGTQFCFTGQVGEVKEGDWLVVHAGLAIAKISEEDARENLAMIRFYLGEGEAP